MTFICVSIADRDPRISANELAFSSSLLLTNSESSLTSFFSRSSTELAKFVRLSKLFSDRESPLSWISSSWALTDDCCSLRCLLIHEVWYGNIFLPKNEIQSQKNLQPVSVESLLDSGNLFLLPHMLPCCFETAPCLVSFLSFEFLGYRR